MNKITKLIAVGLLLIGCTDYSSQVDAEYEEWREKQLAIAVDSIAATMTPDTVTLNKVDTLKTTVRDTVILNKTKVQTDTVVVNKTKYDTVTVKDTVMKVETLIKRDTVIKTTTVHDTVVVNTLNTDTVTVKETVTKVDTLIKRDTVTKVNTIHDTIVEIHKISDNQELLRDTSITVSMEYNGSMLSRTFYGKVANGIFYDTTLYEYGKICGYTCNANGYCYINTSTSNTISVYPKKSFRCNSGAYYAIGAIGDDKGSMISKCGLAMNIKEAFVDGQYVTYFPGWRMVSEKDVSRLGHEIETLIPADSSIFLSVSYASHPNTQYCYGPTSNDNTYVANVATQYGITTKEKPTRYMCAYDLN